MTDIERHSIFFSSKVLMQIQLWFLETAKPTWQYLGTMR